MSERVLEVANITKSYGSTAALRGVSLHHARGEWLGLLGPNGAGKTTLVRAIAGRVVPDGGSMRLLDVELNGGGSAARSARARLGVVPQDVALYGYMTARENLETFGSLCGVRGATLRERVEWALDFTGLRERADDRIQHYSGGMKRRLNIACSILHRPEVILLDEPTVGVDPQSRERVWEMLGELRDAGASLLLTSHQLDEVERVCDRIIIIDHGRVVAEGTVDQLIEQTIGRKRRVSILFDAPPDVGVPIAGFDLRDRLAVGLIESVARDLPPLLEAAARCGAAVEDVRIENPTLQSVFIHLTGRDLRE